MYGTAPELPELNEPIKHIGPSLLLNVPTVHISISLGQHIGAQLECRSPPSATLNKRLMLY